MILVYLAVIWLVIIFLMFLFEQEAAD
jgi:hypothetical protein